MPPLTANSSLGADDLPAAEPQPEPEVITVPEPPLITFKARSEEPEPLDDETFTYDYAAEILKKQIRRAIQRGILDPRHLIARFLDHDDARFTKVAIRNLVEQVYREVITEVGKIEIEVEEVKYLMQNQLLLDELNDELEGNIPLKEKIQLVAAIATVSKDRIAFLKFVGAFRDAEGKRAIQPAKQAERPALPATSAPGIPSYNDLRDDAETFTQTHGG